MEREIYKRAKHIKYVDNEGLDLNMEKPIPSAPVLYFEELKDGTLLVKLWVCNKMPDGWRLKFGALTAPNGFHWICNGRSRFDVAYRVALLRAYNQTSETTPNLWYKK
jgi:hypothetical protein